MINFKSNLNIFIYYFKSQLSKIIFPNNQTSLSLAVKDLIKDEQWKQNLITFFQPRNCSRIAFNHGKGGRE